MGMVINHNIPALQTFNAVTRTMGSLQKSIQKLSSGLRINSAADDAAGLAISEKMRAQIRGLDRAVSNSQDGISMIQTAEGALNETHSILQRMRELSVQSANDTLTQQDRGYIQLEIDQLREEVTRIGNTTQFNKKKLLNGDAAVLWSSNDLKTKAIVNGGLRQVDQFGQKNALEGNYEIAIKAKVGQAEIQKSDIFKIKHKDVLMSVSTNKAAGAESVKVDGLPAGSYTLKTDAAPAGDTAVVTGQYGFAPKPVGEQKLEAGTGAVTVGDDAATDVNTKSGYYAGKTLTFKIGNTEGSIVVDGTPANVDTATKLATDIQTKVQALGGLWADVTVTQDAGKFTITKPSGVLEGQKLTATNADAQALFGTDASVWTKDAGGATITLPQQLTPTVTTPSKNANVLVEVTDVNSAAKSITLKISANAMDSSGVTSTATEEVVLTEGAKVAVLKDLLGATAFELQLNNDMTDTFKKGNKIVYNIASAAAGADVGVKIEGTANDKWDESWGKITDAPVVFGLAGANVTDKELHFKNFYLNTKNGNVYEGDIVLSTNGNVINNTPAGKPLASFEVGFIGQVAKGDVKLRDLDKFWDAQGRFMITDPQTITVTQGDGKKASVTLYANDTLGDVATKLNKAIGTGLGQSKYVDNAGNFAVFVDNGGVGSESVPGTFVIRSVVPGTSGKLSFAGDEDLVKALSLNVIQDAKESNYTVDIKDAHSGKVVVLGANTTGNKLIGVLHPNIDVEFDAMGGLTSKWNEGKKEYVYNDATLYKTTLHLADNTTVFQIGANEGEDMGINIGDMRSHALGLNEVLVTDRESAARSITIIDNAIDKVSTQRAKLGAYQNRLEHTISNLTVAGENLTAAESRIRDADMAKEMMNFTKLNIMLQAGNSMLAQANQLPQNVLTLLR